jgi:hypothetical protein
MRVLPSDRQIAMHEAHHAAALLLLGLPPGGARIDQPSADEAGNVEVDWGDSITPDRTRRVLLAIIVGGRCEGGQGWSDWPLDPDRVPVRARSDADKARYLAERLDFDAVDWQVALLDARHLSDRRKFRRLVLAIAAALEEREVLERADLVRIFEATREETAAWSR